MGLRVLKIGFLIVALGSVAGLVVAIIDDPLGGSFASAVVLGSYAMVYFVFLRPLFQSNKLKKEGLPARAKILRIWDTGVTINDNPQIGMEVEVTADDEGKPPWTTRTKAVVSRLDPHKYQPGVIVAVKYDEEEPHKVVVLGPAGEVPPTRDPAEMEVILKEIQAHNEQLNETGELAQAIVMEFIPMGVNVNGDNPAATLKLKVLPKGDEPFDSEAKGIFGQEGLHKYQPGREITVKFDKWAKEQVSVAWTEKDEETTNPV